ncbi:hypothetical protein [Haloferax gibbonsii]|uniref:Uncharacterized protein n=1 Tax=Haloferax gibbonsii TaxID=35746 RepID=A0A0K1IYT1_HALGI|nr:hypothetical protein [Haloferax gibbonsii]AKU09682.1 hypothetical protein ABY42_17915 [Haloferax gibbonsii]
MSSPRSLFRTVVDKNAPRGTREDAIDELADERATTQLRLVVVTSGLDGRYRRQALNALSRCRATDALDELANDTSLGPPLRERAQEAL